jgi:GTP-binding protein
MCEEGQPGEERRLYLELKLLADVGLVGLPNAGKSTLLSRLSAATPKVAEYPFTTLRPNLGIAELSDDRRLVLADIPGLIEGAHQGHGLGIDFLRHVERTRVLLHLVSVESGTIEDLEARYRVVERELASFSDALMKKPRIVVASKVDVLPPGEAESLRSQLEARLGLAVMSISAVTGQGLQPLVEAASRLVDETVVV